MGIDIAKPQAAEPTKSVGEFFLGIGLMMLLAIFGISLFYGV